MGDERDLKTAEKQEITKLLSEIMSTLEVSKKLCRDHRTKLLKI